MIESPLHGPGRLAVEAAARLTDPVRQYTLIATALHSLGVELDPGFEAPDWEEVPA